MHMCVLLRATTLHAPCRSSPASCTIESSDDKADGTLGSSAAMRVGR